MAKKQARRERTAQETPVPEKSPIPDNESEQAAIKNTIVVTGDLVWDHNLLHDPARPQVYHRPTGNKVLQMIPGGAWYLRSVLRAALEDLVKKGAVELFAPQEEPAGAGRPIGQAYSYWALHDIKQDNKTKRPSQVWRIQQFNGCQVASNLQNAKQLPIIGTLEQDALKKPRATNGQEEVSRQEISDKDLEEPDLLVIDDLCLGFRDHKHLWPPSLQLEEGGPGRIVLKASTAPDESPLYETLFKRFADRLTIVIPAEVLRLRGAKLTEGLSWDRTIEEIAAEFATGKSAHDLARCRRVIVTFGTEGAASFTRARSRIGPAQDDPWDADYVRDGNVEFERFVYHPDEFEGSWKSRRPGRMFGTGSFITAAVAWHEVEPENYPLFFAMARGLAAIRDNHEQGGGPPDAFNPEPVAARVRPILRPMTKEDLAADGSKENPDKSQDEAHSSRPEVDLASDFRSAFPHAVLNDDVMRHQPADQSNLLRDVAGPRLAYLLAKAVEVVQRGPELALASAPKAKYGGFTTVDRLEIETFNNTRRLIAEYLRRPEDTKPCSIAVFGPPGAGKGFAIKQLAQELMPSSDRPLEFNLSEFGLSDSVQLHEAFHQVRDATVRGVVPLVFWDEFDTDDLRWLKYFLAPMQDAMFRAGSILHPFGKAIFVFAGGTSKAFQEFDRSKDADPDIKKFFGSMKGPDFVSRLRGYVNIKGPNPIGAVGESVAPDKDPCFYMRRAMIIRSLLVRNYPHLISRQSDAALVDAAVIRGFLQVDEFLHGARSLEAVLTTSNLHDAERYSVARLPAKEILDLHVSEDFLTRVDEGALETDAMEAAASKLHAGWVEGRIGEGWRLPTNAEPQKFDEGKMIDPRLVDYELLPESAQEENRQPVRQLQAKLADIGLCVERCSPGHEPDSLSPSYTTLELQEFAEIEHDRWARERLLNGWEWGSVKSDARRRHQDILPSSKLTKEEQEYDLRQATDTRSAIWSSGFKIVKCVRD